MNHLKIVALILLAVPCYSQKDIVRELDQSILRRDAEAHLTFLASDEMRGRDAGSPELEIAANYIRTQLKASNVKPAPGTNDYFQQVDLIKHFPASGGKAVIGSDQFTLKENMLVIDGGGVEWTGELIYVGYGSSGELDKVDIKGKMVLALAGSKEADNINKVFITSRDKFADIRKRGALGLVEILAFPQVPWSALINYLDKEHWSLNEEEGSIPFVWLKPKDLRKLSFKEKGVVKGSLSVVAQKPQIVLGKNVAGVVEGTDPALKNEYIVVTAHYDHVGVDKSIEKGDSIFNGARDNATGTVAMLQAAKFLAENPAKRSVILMAVTCEEKGLLGSQWYANNPLIPLNKTVLNVNSDGVGYNDKTRVTSISLGRTNTDDLVRKAATAFNLSLGGDPDPREGFYERSDQVSFAKKGVPAIKLQPGLAEMNEEIFKYYHRTADEVGSLDFDYINRFYKTFVYAIYLIANDPRKPMWVKGDKFEEAGKALYQKE